MANLTKVTLPNGALANDAISFLGAGSLFTTGLVWYVNSVIGSDGNLGNDPTAPLATVQQAVSSARANKGDKIVVMPGHAETVTATSINISKAGVAVICLGNGLERPTFTYGAAAATITVSAANVAFIGGYHIANFLNVASAFTTSAKDTQILGNIFVDNSASLNFLCLATTGAVDNASDGLTFTGNKIYGLAVTDGACVSVLGNLLRLEVNDNIVDKAATNDAGHMVTLSSKIVGGCQILRNILTVVGSSGAAVGIFLTGSGSTSSGVVGFNNVWSLDTTGGLLMTASTGIRPMQNYLSGAVDKSGTLTPTADDPA